MEEQKHAARHTRFVTFLDADPQDERMAAVLITKDHETGQLKAYVKDVEGRPEPDPEAVAMLVQSVALRNL